MTDDQSILEVTLLRIKDKRLRLLKCLETLDLGYNQFARCIKHNRHIISEVCNKKVERVPFALACKAAWYFGVPVSVFNDEFTTRDGQRMDWMPVETEDNDAA